MDKVEKHKILCEKLNAVYKSKNKDYGDSFGKTFREEGLVMARIRLTDKMERFKKLSKAEEREVKDESIVDTLIDMANYALMTILEIQETEKSETSLICKSCGELLTKIPSELNVKEYQDSYICSSCGSIEHYE